MKKIVTLFIFLLITQKGLSTFEVQLETGLVHQTKNEVRIPPASGTTVKFEHLNQGLKPYIRIESLYTFWKRHGFRFVFAPLYIESTGQFSSAINFNNEIFSANQDLTIGYTFNSYRIGYAYSLISDRDEKLKVGLTAKLRSAEIKFTQGSRTTAYQNTGVVPLIYVAYTGEIANDWFLYSDLDFIIAPQGRAIDLTIKMRKYFSEDIYMSLGARTLEGGAENSQVYTKSWFNFFSVDFGAIL